MEEQNKNRASQMLSQMKKIRHLDDADDINGVSGNSNGVAEGVDGSASSASATANNAENSTPPNTKTDKAVVRTLPTEESLFEFDDIAFDDVVAKPVLTPEEAQYAEELSEKFGISTNVGIGFFGDASAAAEVSTDTFGGAEDAPSVDEAADNADASSTDEPADAADGVLDDTDENAAVDSGDWNAVSAVNDADESATIAPVNEISSSDEPEQVTFGVDDASADGVAPVAPSAPSTPVGVQLTFLDSAEPDGFVPEDAEQLSLSDYEEEYDNIDEDDEPNFDDEDGDEDNDSIVEDGALGVITDNTFEDDIADGSEGEVLCPIHDEFEEGDYDDDGDAAAGYSLAIEDGDGGAFSADDGADDTAVAPAVKTEELTPIEIAAMEEAARAAAEEVGEVQHVKAETSFDTDIWDESDREAIAEAKRFSDFCSRLTIPPIKTTKESASAVSDGAPRSSGYRCEMTERLPISPEGKGEGRYTESYINREIAYCNEREEARSKQLLGRLRKASRRLICSFAIMLVVLLVENLGIFLSGTPDALLKTELYTLFGLSVAVLLTLGAVMVYDVIIDGVKSAVRGIVIPETLTALVAVPTIIYHYVIAFCAPASVFSMLFGTGCAVVLFLSGLYRYNMLKRDQITFSVTSSYGDYLTEVKISNFCATPEGRAYDGYVDPDSALYRFNRVNRIESPYSDAITCDECGGLIRKLMLCIVAASVVVGIVFGFLHMDAVYGAVSAISLITYACPAGIFIALSLPRLRAATVSAELGGAIVDFDDEGEEFDAAVIMVDEEELFPPEKLVACDFNFQYSSHIETHISRTRALFKKLGGSFAAMFNKVEGAAQNFETIVITDIAQDGIFAKIDGLPICVGTESYMKRLGYKVKPGEKLLPKTGRYIYVVDNGELAARAMLVFKADEEVVQKISELRNTETVFSLKTCNPCIDEELLFHATGLEPELLKLVKYRTDDPISQSRTDREGNLVSRSGALGLLTALLEYKRQKKLIFEASRFACISCAVGAVVSVVTSAIGVNFGFSSLMVLATQGVMALAAFLMSRSGAINTKSKIKKR